MPQITQRGETLTIQCDGATMKGKVHGKTVTFEHTTGLKQDVKATYKTTLDEKGTSMTGTWHLSARQGGNVSGAQALTAAPQIHDVSRWLWRHGGGICGIFTPSQSGTRRCSPYRQTAKRRERWAAPFRDALNPSEYRAGDRPPGIPAGRSRMPVHDGQRRKAPAPTATPEVARIRRFTSTARARPPARPPVSCYRGSCEPRTRPPSATTSGASTALPRPSRSYAS